MNEPPFVLDATPEAERLMRALLGDNTIRLVKKDAPVNSERADNISA